MKTLKYEKKFRFYYAPFNPLDKHSNMVVVNYETKKPICVIATPYDEIPNDKNFNKRVKQIIKRELEMKYATLH